MFGYLPKNEALVLSGMRHGAIREMNGLLIIMDLIIKSSDTKLKLILAFLMGDEDMSESFKNWTENKPIF